MDVVKKRGDALWATRSFFHARGFTEVDTPLLVPGPGLEPHIDPLHVDIRLDFDTPPTSRWLITSPELALKRLVASGSERIYQLGHVFRDGERTKRHLPEFALLEWYRGHGTLTEIIDDHEDLFAAVAQCLGVEPPKTPFQKMEVRDLFEEHAHIDLDKCLDDPQRLVDESKRIGLVLREGADFEDAFFAVMDQKIEPNIGRDRPMVVSRWPSSMAVLARKSDDDDRYAERFEIYAGGLELSNAFDELTDANEQRARFVADNDKRRALGKPELPLDEDFLAALAKMPRTAGCALGFDRLLMYLLGVDEIDGVTPLRWR